MIRSLLKRSPQLFFVLILLTGALFTQNVYAQTVDCSVAANCANVSCNFAANVERGCHCFDNIDNDGDGKIDKADANCAADYGLTFVGDGSDCSITPPGSNTPFDLVNAPITSSQNTADTQSKISVGDVDGDGDPDAVITSKWNAEMRVVATTGGSAGSVISDFKLTGQGAKIFSGSGACNPKNLLFEHENLIADIDGDKKAEMFGIVSNRGGNPSTPPTCFFLVAFKYAPSSLVPLYDAVQIGTDRPGTFGIADMDGDGKAELYIRDRIYAAETGKLLATGSGNWDLDVVASPAAVDVNGDNTLELITGTKIYTIPSLTNRSPASPAALILYKDMNTISTDKCYVKLMLDPVEYGTDAHSSVSVADIDKDGHIDIVISGALNSENGKTAIFYWNEFKGKVSYYLPQDPSNTNGWPWGTGRVNLIDTDKDQLCDMFFIAGNQLYRLETIGDTFSPTINTAQTGVTKRTINDSRSGVLTVTLYDFDNDGNFELVYRDSQELAVVDALTMATKYWSAVCQSHTYTEGPIIADVNGDGGTDICVPCNTSNSFDITDPIQQQALGQFRLYYSSGNEWLPTRKVWNQPGYFVVNINDDLTLPYPQINQTLVFGTANCPNGLPGPQEPLNVFLDQIPYLSTNGCPVFPAPDLTYYGDNPDHPNVDSNGDGVYSPAVEIVPPICGDLAIKVRFNIKNVGDLPISDNIPVSFFVGDPTKATITSDSLILSTTISVTNLGIDGTYTTPYVTFNGPGKAFRLYIVLNNNGSSLPISLTGASTTECTIVNNMYNAFVNPDPFTTKIVKIQDNSKCVDSAPNDGALRVDVYKGTTKVTDLSPYSFQWYTGTAASHVIINGATNYNLTGLDAGDYTVIVKNTAKGCSALPQDTIVLRVNPEPVVSINVISHQTLCNPANGKLEAVIAGNPPGYTFEWLDITSNPIGIPVGSTETQSASNLVAGNYIVRISKNGCTKNSSPAVVDGPQIPDAQAKALTHVQDCINPNTGSVTADALFSGVVLNPANYTFDWYFYNNATSTRGSILPAANGTGQTRTGLAAGYYQVEITDITTKCKANQKPVAQVLTQTVLPTASITETAKQTSCDPANPNGILTGTGIGTGLTSPNDFTFEWFKGDNTLVANKVATVSGTNGEIVNKVAGGGIYYTLKVTTAKNCSATTKYIIQENIKVPVVTLDSVNNSICNPALAASTFNGKAIAAVSFNNVTVSDFTGYTITWHKGSLSTDPVIAGQTTTTMQSIDGGFYTFVIEKTDVACKSLPVTIQVLNATKLPTINTDSIASTNCAPTPGNGKAFVADVDGLGTGSPFIYQWHTGINTASPIAGATNVILPNLQGGAAANFTVLVTNQNTGCQNTSTVLVPDKKALPLFTLAPSPNTICDASMTSPVVPFNGKVLTTITNQGATSINDYTFKWTDKETNTVIVNDVAGAAGQNILNKDSSHYSLVITQISTGCISNPNTAQVITNATLPAITAIANASTNCPPTTANGQGVVTDVDTNGTGAPYIFQWFNGNTTATILAGETNKLLDHRQGGVGNFYTVRVTNQTNGCRNTAIVEIPDNRVLPLFTLAASPTTICNASLTNPAVPFDGKVLTTITNQGAALISDYKFKWTDNETNTVIVNDVVGAAGQNILNKDSSKYTLVVTQISSGCISNPVTAQVTINVTLPVVTAIASASTNCPPTAGNGKAIVTDVDTNGTGVPYVFQWFNGNTTAVLLAGETNATLSNRQGGVGNFYTARVTDQSNGCRNTAIVEIPDNRVLPLFTLAASPTTICDASLTSPAVPFDGKVLTTITNQGAALITDYKFKWTDEETNAVIVNNVAGAAGQNILNKDSSDYSLIITQISTGCISNPKTATVTVNVNLPVISKDANASTNCLPSPPDGQAFVTDVDGAGTGAPFAFQWFNGNTTAVSLPGETNALLDNRQGGVGNFYTVRVTDQSNGCRNTAVVEIPDAHVFPLFTLTPSPNSICNPALTIPSVQFTGQVDATITNQGTFPISDYHFKWTDNENGAVVFDVDGGGATLGESLTQRDSSTYTLIVTQLSTGCISNPVSAQVTATKVLPIITADANASTNCDHSLADGGVQVTFVDAVAPPNNHVFEWYTGSVVGINPADLVALTAASPDTIQGGVGNFFTVLATDLADGCQSTKVVEVQDNHILPLFTLMPSPNGICNPSLTVPSVPFGGKVDATITNQGAFAITDYHFQWTDEENGAVVFNAVGGGATVGESLIQRDSSDYTLVITQISTGCISSPVTAQVTSIKILPVITADANASTNCDPALANGGVQVTLVDGAAPPNNHAFEWYTGNVVGVNPTDLIALAAASPDTLQGAPGRFYTVLVTDLSDGCQSSKVVEVPHAPVKPLFTLQPSPNTICDPSATVPIGALYDGHV
jgi:hypothetical protein